MRRIYSIASVIVVLLLLGVAVQPAVAKAYEDDTEDRSGSRGPDEVPPPFRELSALVADLIKATTDMTDTDNDGLPDTVEWVIGTNASNPDSDFDRLTDSQEVDLQTDPLKPDSNDDKMPDYHEVTDVDLDIDGDGVPNAWDWDNDDDGVMDSLDISPFTKTDVRSEFHLEIETSGAHTYITFQLRTRDPDHMRLIFQEWDWPFDDKAQMRDLDGSTEDVTCTPVLVFESDVLPDPADTVDYAISVVDGTAYIPLIPVWEFGNVVALKGKMYYPRSASGLSISADLRLNWQVIGTTDAQVHSLKMASGQYLSLAENETLVANAATVDDPQLFEVVHLAGEDVALKGPNGRYLQAMPDGSVVVNGTDIDSPTVFLMEEQAGDMFSLRSEEGYYLTEADDGTIKAISSSVGNAEAFDLTEGGFRSELAALAVYPDDFMLAGFEVEESHGAHAGHFYSGDVDNLVATNLVLAYDFLRISSNDLSAMPPILSDRGISVDNSFYSYDHSDLAYAEMLDNTTRSVVESLPDGMHLPIISAMEEMFTSQGLENLREASTEFYGDLTIDLTGEPILTVKTLRTVWYDTDTDEPMEMEEVIEEIDSWGLEPEPYAVMVGLTIAWYAGEQTLAREGAVEIDYNITEVGSVNDSVGSILTAGLAGLDILFLVFIKNIDTIYASIKFVHLRLHSFGDMSGKLRASVHKTNFKASHVSTASPKWMRWAGNTLEVLGFAVDLVFAVLGFIAIGSAFGWSTYGFAIAITYFVLTVVISAYVLYWALGGAGPAGVAVALILALADLIGWLIFDKTLSEFIVEGIIGYIYKVRQRSEVDLDIVNSTMDIKDMDGNGLDVGDRITYTGYYNGIVTLTSHGYGNDLTDGYLRPTQTMTVPVGSSSDAGSNREGLSTTRDSDSKVTEYRTEAWVEPGIAMVNFPVDIGLHGDWHINYEECWGVPGLYKCDRYRERGSFDSHWMTLYFDVMPATVGDFSSWRGIVSNDPDGDGLETSDETDSNPWMWDTDGDLLGDAYETELGTDPGNADTDGDGLDDRYEHIHGTNATDEDTDGDGLTDYLEYSGWVVTFDYYGTEFSWNVNGDPNQNRTDGDDIDDFMEWRTLQNPASSDTDGDGEEDQLKDYYVTELSLSMETDQNYDAQITDLVVDDEGFFYVSVDWGNTCQIDRFDPNGSLNASFGSTELSNPRGIAIDAEGRLLVVDQTSTYNRVVVMDFNGTVLDTWSELDGGIILLEPYYITVARNGTVYVTDTARISIQKFAPDGTFMGEVQNGTLNRYVRSIADVAVGVDGKLFVTDPQNNSVHVFDENEAYIGFWGNLDHSSGSGLKQFSGPTGLEVDRNGDVLVSDSWNHRIQKFDDRGNFIANYTHDESTYGIDSDDRFIYFTSLSIYRLFHNVTLVPATPAYDFTDADEDGLEDVAEDAGWTVSVTDLEGARTYHVTSDPLVVDTDGDGLVDLAESTNGSDPRTPDTDGDGLDDWTEAELGTDITAWDTDGDGLDDGIELSFTSDPLERDTDGDGLEDGLEFLEGTDPRDPDTDDDGLDDWAEVNFGSDPMTQDRDGDLMFDGREAAVGSGPDDADSDGDGLMDGHEDLYGTDATNGDSDGDDLSDAYEVSSRTDPLLNDTDGDGVADGLELERGLNPLNNDTDQDGIPDHLDSDHLLHLGDDIILAYDPSDANTEFVDEISSRATVSLVTLEELLDDHTSARYIVLLGDPDAGEGTVGDLMADLLADTPDVLEGMRTTNSGRLVTRYGHWTDVQTIVMVAFPEALDHFRALGVLKSMTMTITDGAVAVQYHNPRACIRFGEIDQVRATDTIVSARLDGMLTFNYTVARRDDSSIGHAMTNSTGLTPVEVAMGKYIDIQLDEGLLALARELVVNASINIHYTEADLDLTGDGDADDPEDLDESTLQLYLLNETTGTWELLSPDLGFVLRVDVNTTDVNMYGMEYSGNIWAHVTHLSTFGIAGRRQGELPVIARAGDDIKVTVGKKVNFDGTSSSGNGVIVNWTWTFEYKGSTVVLYGPEPSFTFKETGTYEMSLEVTDFVGRTSVDVMTVKIEEESSNTWSWLVVAIALVLLAMVLIMYIGKRRVRGPP